jgi:hypothetical protein
MGILPEYCQVKAECLHVSDLAHTQVTALYNGRLIFTFRFIAFYFCNL